MCRFINARITPEFIIQFLYECQPEQLTNKPDFKSVIIWTSDSTDTYLRSGFDKIFFYTLEWRKWIDTKWNTHLALNIPRAPPRSCPFGNSLRNSWVRTTGTPIFWSSNKTDTSSLSTESMVASWYLRITNILPFNPTRCNRLTK